MSIFVIEKEKLDLKYKNLHLNQNNLYICPIKYIDWQLEKPSWNMKKATLILMLFCLGFISPAKAQQKTVVYGHLGMENVNVSISNT